MAIPGIQVRLEAGPSTRIHDCPNLAFHLKILQRSYENEVLLLLSRK